MAQDALEGESELTETAGSAKRLQQLLGLGDPPRLNGATETSVTDLNLAAGACDQPAKCRGRYVGERKPKRDKIGKEPAAD